MGEIRKPNHSTNSKPKHVQEPDGWEPSKLGFNPVGVLNPTCWLPSGIKPNHFSVSKKEHKLDSSPYFVKLEAAACGPLVVIFLTHTQVSNQAPIRLLAMTRRSPRGLGAA